MIRCPQCNRKQPLSVLTCDCGYDLQTYRQQLAERERVSSHVQRPYQVLPLLQSGLRLLAGLSLLSGLVGAIALYVQEFSIWLVFSAFLGGVALTIPYLAGAESIQLLLDVSERQHEIQQRLDRLEQGEK